MFIAVLSDNPGKRTEFCKMAGKETGKGDISFYSSNFQGTIRTLIEPTLYPEKIQPLLHALSFADYVVFIADSPSRFTGEIVVAADLLKKGKGMLISGFDLPLKGTALENYERVGTLEEAREKVLSLEGPDAGGELFALVDSSFSVKSVGNVILGGVKSGKIRKRDKLVHLPGGGELEVKSIQLNDKDVEEAPAGARFGICYKGELVERGILAPEGSPFTISSSIKGEFSKSPFYKGELSGKIHAYSMLQLAEGSITGDSLSLEKPLAFRKDEPILILDPGNPKLRICGVFVPG